MSASPAETSDLFPCRRDPPEIPFPCYWRSLKIPFPLLGPAKPDLLLYCWSKVEPLTIHPQIKDTTLHLKKGLARSQKLCK